MGNDIIDDNEMIACAIARMEDDGVLYKRDGKPNIPELMRRTGMSRQRARPLAEKDFKMFPHGNTGKARKRTIGMELEAARGMKEKSSEDRMSGGKWKGWFRAAEESGTPQFMRFARLKMKSIDGLISHAVHPISTGRLEGLNNKIKAVKRVDYGYHDDDYFFMLIRCLALPSVRHLFYTIP